jgi:hypothetical protein
VLTLISLSFLAAAPIQGTSTQDETTVKAKAAFELGTALYKQGKYAEAVLKFQETYALKPHPTVMYNIGRCRERLEEIPRALTAYREYLRIAPDASDASAVTAAIERIEKRFSEKGVQLFQVTANPENAKIEVDGTYLGTSPAAIQLPAGNHRLVVKLPGYETETKSFVVTATRSIEMNIVLRKEGAVDVPKVQNELVPSEKKPDISVGVEKPIEVAKKPKVAAWVTAGLAVLAGGTGVAFGVMSDTNGRQLRGEIAREPLPTNFTLQKDMSRNATIANASFVTAGVAGIASVILFFVEGN